MSIFEEEEGHHRHNNQGDNHAGGRTDTRDKRPGDGACLLLSPISDFINILANVGGIEL